VTYKIFGDETTEFKTKVVQGDSTSPNFGYEQVHSICPVTELHNDWIGWSGIVVKVWGTPVRIRETATQQTAQVIEGNKGSVCCTTF
jgi:hypothetical protein